MSFIDQQSELGKKFITNLPSDEYLGAFGKELNRLIQKGLDIIWGVR